MSSIADLVIVGGGPAGTAAAIMGTLTGLKVCLLEERAFPRVRPGETLHPGVQPLMAQLGLEEQLLVAGFPRHAGIWVAWHGQRRFEPFGADDTGPWRGFQAWRADFDSMLLDRARALGTEVRQPCRVHRPIVEDGRVVGVETAGGSLRARFLIDAAGGTHWLARGLSLPIERHSPTLIARYGYALSSQWADERLPVIMADRSGWTWHAKVRDDLYHWARLALRQEAADPCAFARNDKQQRIRGADVTWRLVSRPAGPGYFVVGDAAAVLDPASSHGVLKSLMGGILAAQMVRRGLDNPRQEALLQESYGSWIKVGFQQDTRKLTDLYRTLPNPPSWLSDHARLIRHPPPRKEKNHVSLH